MQRFLRAIGVMLLLMMMSASISAQAALDTERIDQIAADLMAEYDIPGVSLAVVDDGAMQYAQGYGVRSVETGEPMTVYTQSSIGSITKSFTALAIQQQVDAGVLDLDAPITTYLPDFHLSDPAVTEQLTLRALLANAAGFAPDDLAWYSGSLQTIEEVVAYIETRPITSQPGTEHAYNNIGYTLAGYVLETVTGQSYEDYVREHILAPLGMTRTSFSFDEMQTADDYAAPHLYDVHQGGAQVIPYFDNIDAIAPAGAVDASVVDMANYLILQLGDGTFNGERIVSQAGLTDMHAEQVDGYGLGWVPAPYEGYATVWHNGSIDGFYALAVLVPSENLGVVTLMNADYVDYMGFAEGLVYRVIDTVLDLEPEQDMLDTLQLQLGFSPEVRQSRAEAAQRFDANPADYAPYVGEYSSSLGDISIAVEDDRLMLHLTMQSLHQVFELVEFEPNRFIGNGRGITSSVFEFETTADGRVLLLQNGETLARKLLENVESVVYTDPENRFSVSVPQGWSLEIRDGIGVLTSTEQGGTFLLGAGAAGDDLQADAAAFAALVGFAVSGSPVATNPIPLPNGQTWTQYVWLTESGAVVAVNAYAQGGIAYYIGLQGEQTEVQEMLLPLNELLLGFTITE